MACDECDQLRAQIETLQNEIRAKDLVIANNFQQNPLYEEDYGLSFVFTKRACEDLYFQSFGDGKSFSDEEWELVKDRFNECIATKADYAQGDFDDLKHYARDAMWYVLGFPVCILFFRGDFYNPPIRRIDVRITVGNSFYVTNITSENILEVLWEKEKNVWLKENGWCKHEITLRLLNTRYSEVDDELEHFGGHFNNLSVRHRKKYLQVNSQQGSELSFDSGDIWERLIDSPIQMNLYNRLCECEQEESEQEECDDECDDEIIDND